MRSRSVAFVAAVVCGLTAVAGAPAQADPDPISTEGESQYALTGDPLDMQATQSEAEAAAAGVSAPYTPKFGPSIENYAGNDSQDTCQSGERPGPVALRALLNNTYDLNRTGNISRGCNVGGTSEHKEGRALDYMLNVNDAHQRDIANTVVDWMLATDRHGNRHAVARRWGIMYIIWNRRIWSASRASEGWRSYSGASPHTDHVHFSFGWPGARKETSWWTQAQSSATTDFNGDGASDIGLYRKSEAQWWLYDLKARKQLVGGHQYGGNASDIPLSGDFDGDGYTDIALYRKSEGQWWLKSTHDNRQIAGGLEYGGDASDIPVVGDFNGDGVDDIGVYRAGKGEWWLYNVKTRGGIRSAYKYGGDASDIPLTGDFDNDGHDDIALYRKGAGQWHVKSPHLDKQLAGSLEYGGNASDIPLAGDFNGDGYSDIALYRKSEGQWWVYNLRARKGLWGPHPYGGDATDLPVVGDYNGDGRTDIALYRAGNGTWWAKSISTGAQLAGNTPYGGNASDIPVP